MAVDPASHEVVTVELTHDYIHDRYVIKKLLSNQIHIGKVYGDGAYSYKQSFDAVADKGETLVIAIGRGTGLVKYRPSKGDIYQLVKEIWASGGKTKWKKMSGYHLRSLVETHMFWFNTILGDVLRNRTFDHQVTEVRIIAKILNKMTSLGMHKFVRVF